MMETFMDENGAIVRLSFEKDIFKMEPKHVLVICRTEKHWLLTNHKKRGLEFPGGKLEPGETLEQAAAREVLEETGALLNRLEWLGEYEVSKEADRFVKAIYAGEVSRIETRNHYFETTGPVLIKGDLLSERFKDEYSFIMKDKVVEKSVQRFIQNENKQHN
ncbi:RNA deprotection pyrophosphohydrolase [Cytobacillus purgationiresistens]|uniref:8-oxo-dGTP diphosphatase n=1 Tax=Cytobacillus purgationiresistens TaxID=863449 RepID=A0ABU0ANE0_9BACI|nr:nucleoside triphosphatase YtkD [Cytobacillus purgationiresistens]MDQ0272271.1 8-oxo-dGTP diphosphatase [Cytobacillus purgationiresistens]